MKRVVVFGTFDVFHPGHMDFLKQAKEYGSDLTVVIARNKTVFKIKGRLPKNSESKRMKKVSDSGLAQEVILGNEGDKYKIIKDLHPDVICLGYDQKFFVDKLRSKLDEFGLDKTEIIRLKSFKPEIYKSSKLEKYENN